MPCHLALLLLLAQPAPEPAAPPQSGEPRVVLESAAGEVRARALRGFRTEDPRGLDASFVRFEGFDPSRTLAARSDACELRLLTGDRIFGRVVGGREEDLELELLGGVPFTVPVDGIASLRFAERIPLAGAGSLEPAEEGDRLYRTQGRGLDRVEGTLESFDAEGVVFEGVVGSKHYDWDEVAALFIDALGGFGPEDRDGDTGVPVAVDLVDQSRIRGELVLLSQDGCRLRAAYGQDVVFPAWAVSEVTVDDGRLRFLSDVPVQHAEEGSPFGDDLGLRWPHRMDRSVTGASLRAGGRTHARGIGVHAPSRLTWALDGGWKTLRGAVAIDDQVLRLASRGSVVFRVHVDGEKRWESPVVRGGDPPLALPAIDLAGAKELELEVDMASDFFIADRADWLRMVMVRGD